SRWRSFSRAAAALGLTVPPTLTTNDPAAVRAFTARHPQGIVTKMLSTFALDREGEAMQRYLQAIEIDPDYIEAWNNLGNVLSIQGQLEDAVAAYSQALTIEQDYADAHCNLADTLDQLGRSGEAREHWQRYLELDPDSNWAERVRERLEDASQ
nr:tetratricopeptide repeat protein [Planctomycetota bacterium]